MGHATAETPPPAAATQPWEVTLDLGGGDRAVTGDTGDRAPAASQPRRRPRQGAFGGAGGSHGGAGCTAVRLASPGD